MKIRFTRTNSLPLLIATCGLLLALTGQPLAGATLVYEFSGIVADPLGPPDVLGLSGQPLAATFEIDSGANPSFDNGFFAGYDVLVTFTSPAFSSPLIGSGPFSIGYGTGLDELVVSLSDPVPGVSALGFRTVYCAGIGCLFGDGSLPEVLPPPSSLGSVIVVDDQGLVVGSITETSASVTASNIPEPSTMLLLGGGLVIALSLKRRKAREH